MDEKESFKPISVLRDQIYVKKKSAKFFLRKKEKKKKKWILN